LIDHQDILRNARHFFFLIHATREHAGVGGRARRIAAVLLGTMAVAGACGSADDVVFEDGEAATFTPTTPTAPDTPSIPTTTAPPETTSASSESAPMRTVTLSFTGDTLAHSPLWRRAKEYTGGTGYDFFPMFADIAPTISRADLSTCHLETPIAPAGEDFSTDPLYGVPPEIVTAMARAGYDRCSTASNHVLDRGVGGIDRTVEVLVENGMGQAGMARNELESLPSVFDVNGVRIGHLSYTYDTNGIPIPRAEPWRTNLIDPVRIVRDANSARDLGAEVVVVSMHWGTEREAEPNEQQLAVADEITASGAIDLVIGHHAHVVQPIEQINGVWVAYGIGNILSNLPVSDYWPASSQDAVILEVQLDVDAGGVVSVARPNVIPTWVDKQNGWVINDVAAQLGRDDLPPSKRDDLQRSLERTAAVLGDYIT